MIILRKMILPLLLAGIYCTQAMESDSSIEQFTDDFFTDALNVVDDQYALELQKKMKR